MSNKSLIAIQKGIEKANIQMTEMQLTQQTLAVRLGMTRQPIGKFFKGQPVKKDFFVSICNTLGLDWKDITERPEELLDIDRLVQITREAIEPIIRERCGQMKVLDMPKPIELIGNDGIYADVKLLKYPTRYIRMRQELLASNGEILAFDHEQFAGRKIQRLSGLTVAQKNTRLMVWGKPGAGKTTFLKYLAMQCITSTGGSATDKVPFFVTLKDFAEAPRSPSLLKYLARSVSSTQEQPFYQRLGGIDSGTIVKRLLQNGRALILLDGLDEVLKKDSERVIREIKNAAERFYQSQFVITCRIAAKEYVFESFKEVEVADFDKQQIKTFAKNWFLAKNDPKKARDFVQELRQNVQIQELASNPLLLTLLCLVFGDNSEFHERRANLYREGVKILLKKWDAARNIKRDKLYKSLDVQWRKDLLSSVALKTFLRGELILEQWKLEDYIADFLHALKNQLKDVDPDSEILRADSEAVLKCIEAHHGLLVERAKEFYSFSHLTLHEYFAAREICLTKQFSDITTKFSDRHWREVFLLAMEMSRDAGDLLKAIKKTIDSQLADDQQIHSFLQWVQEKSTSVLTDYRSSAVNAFYYSLSLSFDYELAKKIDPKFNYKVCLYLKLDNALIVVLNRAIARADISIKLEVEDALEAAKNANSHELFNQLQELYKRLPESDSSQDIRNWKETEGQLWVRDLRECMINYRGIGKILDFTHEQIQLLRQYYKSSSFLWECLNSKCYVDPPIRENIEKNLLSIWHLE